MKKLVIISLFLATNAFALDCDNAITTLDMNACAKQEQEKVENELNLVYKQVIKSLSVPDTEVIKYSKVKSNLIQAERSWVKFRKADCDATYSLHQSGSIRNLMYLGCMQSHAEQRIEQLKEFEQ